MLGRVSECLHKFFKKTVLNLFDVLLILLTHRFLGDETQAFKCLFHELASNHDARGVFLKPGGALDVVQKLVEIHMTMHLLVN